MIVKRQDQKIMLPIIKAVQPELSFSSRFALLLIN